MERASIRQWKDEAVPEEKIEAVLKAAMASPSAMNARPWRFYVVTNKEVLKQLSEISPYSHFAAKAPVMIGLSCLKENDCPDYNQIDMGICIENILIEAVEQGLGAVCLGVAPLQDRMEAMEKILNIPDTEEAYALIPMGVPAMAAHIRDTWQPERIEWIR